MKKGCYICKYLTWLEMGKMWICDKRIDHGDGLKIFPSLRKLKCREQYDRKK